MNNSKIKFLRSIRGEFYKNHFDYFDTHNIKYHISKRSKNAASFPKSAAVVLVEDESYSEILEVLKDARINVNKRTLQILEAEKFHEYSYFLLRQVGPMIANLYNKNSCRLCYSSSLDQTDFLHFEQVKKLDPKYLFGSSSSISNHLITNKPEIFKEAFGIESIPIFVGEERKKSTSYVALDIPISKSKLNFCDSGYGRIHRECKACGNRIYDGLAHELFPNFDTDSTFHICRTQEIYTSFMRPIIVSYVFATFMVSHGYKWDTLHFIPLKKNPSKN